MANETNDHFFIQWRGKTTGPLSQADVLTQSKAGQITRFHMVSSDQLNWKPAGELDWIFTPKPEFVYTPAATAQPAPELQTIEESSESNGPPVENSQWKYSIDNGPEIGPVPLAVIKQLAASGQLKPGDQVFLEGSSEWVSARKVKGIVFGRPEKNGAKSFKQRRKEGLSQCSNYAAIILLITLPIFLLWPLSPVLVVALYFAFLVAFAAFVLAIIGIVQSKDKALAAFVFIGTIVAPAVLPIISPIVIAGIVAEYEAYCSRSRKTNEEAAARELRESFYYLGIGQIDKAREMAEKVRNRSETAESKEANRLLACDFDLAKTIPADIVSAKEELKEIQNKPTLGAATGTQTSTQSAPAAIAALAHGMDIDYVEKMAKDETNKLPKDKLIPTYFETYAKGMGFYSKAVPGTAGNQENLAAALEQFIRCDVLYLRIDDEKMMSREVEEKEKQASMLHYACMKMTILSH